MKTSRGRMVAGLVAWLFVLGIAAIPALAADDSAPDPTTTTVGFIFRWFNFLVVVGVLAYVMVKAGGPYFRGQAQAIFQSIREAAEAKAAAEREVADADRRLAHLQDEIEELRRAAKQEAAAETERIRALTRTEADKIQKAAQAEIGAAERAGQQEMRNIAARVATDKAVLLLAGRMNPARQAALFQSFVGKLERSAS
jgi:F0F1-type ATP synthase membrane subunit b/b'